MPQHQSACPPPPPRPSHSLFTTIIITPSPPLLLLPLIPFSLANFTRRKGTRTRRKGTRRRRKGKEIQRDLTYVKSLPFHLKICLYYDWRVFVSKGSNNYKGNQASRSDHLLHEANSLEDYLEVLAIRVVFPFSSPAKYITSLLMFHLFQWCLLMVFRWFYFYQRKHDDGMWVCVFCVWINQFDDIFLCPYFLFWMFAKRTCLCGLWFLLEAVGYAMVHIHGEGIYCFSCIFMTCNKWLSIVVRHHKQPYTVNGLRNFIVVMSHFHCKARYII